MQWQRSRRPSDVVIRREARDTLCFLVRKACLDQKVLPLDVAEFARPLQKRSVPLGTRPGLARTKTEKPTRGTFPACCPSAVDRQARRAMPSAAVSGARSPAARLRS
jgi:hypothetical protein